MFDSLGFKLQETVQKLSGQGKITEQNVEGALADIRRNLIEADVSLTAVKLFTSRIRKEALGQSVLTGINPGQQLTKIIYDALVEILGGNLAVKEEDGKKSVLNKLELKSKPSTILLLGLQGAGKTTAAAKLALKLKDQNPLLVPCDLQRPAAVKQLKILAAQAQVDFLDITAQDESKYLVVSPLELVKLASQKAQEQGNGVLIFDTAGRLQIDTDLMAELLLLEKQIKPDEKLLVIDSLIGQEAANVAQTFHTQIKVTGILLTKLDSDTRGGAALSVVEAVQQPIKLASVGEKLEDLEIFYPDRMATRILGMADVLTLVEKAQERFDEEESKKLEAELMKGNFNYDTFMTFQNMVSKLGDFAGIFKMMGMGQMLNSFGLNPSNQEALFEQGQTKMKRFQIAIRSMTKEERKNPQLLSIDASARSRKNRITKGSGLKEADITNLVNEFSRMSKMFKNIGPMLGMMQNQNKPVDPMDMLGQMMGGLNKQQKKALKMRGMPASVPAAKPVNPPARPSIKGFRN